MSPRFWGEQLKNDVDMAYDGKDTSGADLISEIMNLICIYFISSWKNQASSSMYIAKLEI